MGPQYGLSHISILNFIYVTVRYKLKDSDEWTTAKLTGRAAKNNGTYSSAWKRRKKKISKQSRNPNAEVVISSQNKRNKLGRSAKTLKADGLKMNQWKKKRKKLDIIKGHVKFRKKL